MLAGDLEDYKDYCKELIEFGKLPCLPKDLENLRAANTQFAQDNHELLKLAEDLNEENKDLLKRWEDALDRTNSLSDQLWEKDKEIKGLESENKELLQRLEAKSSDLYVCQNRLNLARKHRDEAVDCFNELNVKYLEDGATWNKKWQTAVEMAAIAENKLDQKTKDFNDLWDNYIEALKKLDKIEEIL